MARRAALGCLPAVLLALQFGTASGESKAMNFHMAHIDWKMCHDTVRDGKVIPGFYDPAYPEVCADRSNSKKVGFTLHAQWPNGGTDPLSMLLDFSSQIIAFRDDCNSTLQYDPPPGKADGKICYLSVSYGTDPTMQRKIGWRKGLGEKSIPLSPPRVVTSAAKLDSGDSRDYQSQVYNFVIERESRDLKTVYARFSWEIEFDEGNQYYTVFWEGCCRPEELVNNKGLVYHVRTELFVNSESSPDFPLSSFKFTVPAEVSLKRQGPGACEQIYCRPGDCFIDYRIQGYHEQPEWHQQVYFRKGTANEMGKYKCVEKADVTDPESQLIWMTDLCPPGHTVTSFEGPDYQLFDSSAALKNVGGLESVAGVVRFEMQQDAGVYQQSVVAEILLPNGIRLAHVLDSKVKVSVMQFNDQPFTYSPKFNELGQFAEGQTAVNILSAAWNQEEPSYPIKSTPIQIQCGKPFFFLHSRGALRQDGGPRTREEAEANALGRSIDFAFLDPDFRRPEGSCGQFQPQTIDFIDAANMLPKGLVVSETIHNEDNGVSKVMLHWTPQCEDRSQVGLFQVCFYAKDKSQESGFTPSYSIPSAYPSLWTQKSDDVAIQYHPTCIFLNSLGPAPNPAPVLNTRDSSGRQRIPPVCCGTTVGQNAVAFPICQAGGDEGTDGSGVRVGNEYVLGCIEGQICNSVYDLTVSAESQNDFFRTDIRFFYPDATVVTYYQVSEPKYGCDELNFEDCVSNMTKTRKVARKLMVNIEPNMDSNQLRICYQGFQISPENVDEDEWEQLYRSPPASQSCVTCFILNIINAPVWPQESQVDNTYPIEVAVGTTKSIKLTARNLGSGDTNIFVLADPGAPDGSRLGPIQQEDRVFSRVFEYTPTAEQAGLTSKVCFTASTVQEGSDEPVDSVRLCYELVVHIEQVKWEARPCPFDHSGECTAQGVRVATVGCKTQSYIAAIGGTENHYDLKVQMKKYPHCDNCFINAGPAYKNKSAVISVVKCDDQITSQCCGDNICNGAESGSGCPEDCQKDHSSLVLEEREDGTVFHNRGTFEFTPLRHQQGRQMLVCIEATTDAAGIKVISQKRGTFSSLAPSFCIVFDVESCRYCVPAGATLKSVARHYLLNVDWLRLYNNNPEVANPDMLLPEKKIQVGPLYTVAPGDTLLSVAATMKTTVKMIMQNNPNIPEDQMIQPDTRLCVLLCSNA